MDMTTVSVANLKQKLSTYLHQVEDGEEFIVTSHQRAVARVVPVKQQTLHMRPPMAKIATLAKLTGVTLSPGRTAVDLLLEDRSRR